MTRPTQATMVDCPACVVRVALALSIALGALLSGCASVASEPGSAQPDRAMFDSQVWPVLVRDCGYSQCHGSRTRFFRVVGPGHERLDPTTRQTDPVTEAELQFSFDRARSMVNPKDPSQSLLLRKPLELAAGGARHEGADSFGMDVYRSVDNPRFRVLVQWVLAVGTNAQSPTP